MLRFEVEKVCLNVHGPQNSVSYQLSRLRYFLRVTLTQNWNKELSVKLG